MSVVSWISMGTVVVTIWVKVTTSGLAASVDDTVLVDVEAVRAWSQSANGGTDVDVLSWGLGKSDLARDTRGASWVSQVTLGPDGLWLVGGGQDAGVDGCVLLLDWLLGWLWSLLLNLLLSWLLDLLLSLLLSLLFNLLLNWLLCSHLRVPLRGVLGSLLDWPGVPAS